MRSYNVCGIGNALVDILVKVPDEALERFGLKKGTMRLVSHEEQSAILDGVKGKEPHLVSGGSVANSIVALAELGARTAFVCTLGDDRYGLFFVSECEALGITLPNTPILNGVTGTSICLITPDGERTMSTALGISSRVSADDVKEDVIESSEWVFIEGYLFANPQFGHGCVREAVRLSRKHRCKIVFTLSESWIVKEYKALFMEVLPYASLVFANEAEACTLAEVSSVDEAFRLLSEKFPGLVVTVGERGALVSVGGERFEVPSFPCEPIDLTGAGDLFAAGFLKGLLDGMTPVKAARAGCYLASKVICQIGARLPKQKVCDYWLEAIR